MHKFHSKKIAKLKILHLNTFDISGGAAKAANRLHRGLIDHDVQSRMLVQVKKGDDWRITRPLSKFVRSTGLFRPFLDSLPLFIYPHRSTNLFSPATTFDFIQPETRTISPDIIHLHWINYGFVRIETLKRFSCPIVWTFHDMWPFTGGCHVDKNCGRYVEKCGFCPQLGSKKQRDLSYRVWKRKLNVLKNLDITIVTPSNWLAKCVRKSSLFKNRHIHVIPNGMNLNSFKPISKSSSRKLWNLSKRKKIILFGSINAMRDRNKGFHLIQEAMHILKENAADSTTEVIIFGAEKPRNAPRLGLKTHYLGQLNDETSLTTLYSAADVMVVPSLQESFGQTASEALACGCPVVAFKTTGLTDIVNHCKNGFLCQPFEADNLAKGIGWVLEDQKRHTQLSITARSKAIREYDISKIACQYKSLYHNLLSR